MSTFTTDRTCDLYQRAVAAGEEPSDVVGQLAQMEGVQRPAIWRRLRSGGALPPYNRKGEPPRPRMARRKRTEIRDERDTQPRVHRDPCPRCGARGDYPCGHSGVRLGVVL